MEEDIGSDDVYLAETQFAENTQRVLETTQVVPRTREKEKTMRILSTLINANLSKMY